MTAERSHIVAFCEHAIRETRRSKRCHLCNGSCGQLRKLFNYFQKWRAIEARQVVPFGENGDAGRARWPGAGKWSPFRLQRPRSTEFIATQGEKNGRGQLRL
jgi:hypothetical protein